MGNRCVVREQTARAQTAMQGLPRPREVDEATLGIDVHELDAHAIADVEPGRAFDDFAFGDRLADSYPRAFLGRARHDAVELLADAIDQQQCGRGFADLALDLVGVLFLRRAVSGELAQFVVGVDGRFDPSSAALSKR